MTANHSYWTRRYRELQDRDQRLAMMLAKDLEYQSAYQWLANHHQPSTQNDDSRLGDE